MSKPLRSTTRGYLCNLLEWKFRQFSTNFSLPIEVLKKESPTATTTAGQISLVIICHTTQSKTAFPIHGDSCFPGRAGPRPCHPPAVLAAWRPYQQRLPRLLNGPQLFPLFTSLLLRQCNKECRFSDRLVERNGRKSAAWIYTQLKQQATETDAVPPDLNYVDVYIWTFPLGCR